MQSHFQATLMKLWKNINRKQLRNKLRTPIFEIANSNNPLGSWNSQTRTLRIALRVFRSMSVIEFKEILKHEMAHQYADECLGGLNEPPHGESFRLACKILQIADHVRFRAPENADPRLEKVKKLLALAESNNPHEAEVAMTRAQELMRKYQLELCREGKNPYAYRLLGDAVARRGLCLQLIVSILVQFFQVQGVWMQTQLLANGKNVYNLEIYGRPGQLDIAAYVYDFLLKEIELLWHNHRAQNPHVKGASLKRDFQSGILLGLKEKLAISEYKQQQANPDQHALIKLMDEELGIFVKARHDGRLHSGGSLSMRGSQTFEEGFEQGKNLNIRPGIKKPNKKSKMIAG